MPIHLFKMTDLFVYGGFKSHSGEDLGWKIDCDALTDSDIECMAKVISKRVGVFDVVHGIPKGGDRLAKALGKYKRIGYYTSPYHVETIPLVDDVLTTGKSMAEAKGKLRGCDVKGFVIFARGKCPEWVNSVFNVDLEELE